MVAKGTGAGGMPLPPPAPTSDAPLTSATAPIKAFKVQGSGFRVEGFRA
jgi:hypothetical protein